MIVGFILLLIVSTSDSRGGVAVIDRSFKTLEACERAHVAVTNAAQNASSFLSKVKVAGGCIREG